MPANQYAIELTLYFESEKGRGVEWTTTENVTAFYPLQARRIAMHRWREKGAWIKRTDVVGEKVLP